MLITGKKQIKKIAREMGVPLAHIKDRRTGKSTQIAFETFYLCYINKGKWVFIRDHFCNRKADEFLFRKMRKMADDLGFEFEWDKTILAVRIPIKD